MFWFIIHLFGFFSPSHSNILLRILKMVQSFENENTTSEITREVQ
jgi:hypothetical protein